MNALTTRQAVADPPWAGTGNPATPQAWVRRAEEVASILAVDAVERDREPTTPYDEVHLLKQAGLVTLLGPAPHGGAGQGWQTAYRVVRRVAEGDRSVGRLLGYHYIWSRLPALIGTAGQAEELLGTSTRERWLFGGTVGPWDTDLVAVDTGRDLVFSGRTTFSTGSAISDVAWLQAGIDGHEAHVVALAPSDHPGITVHDGTDAPAPSPTEGRVSVDDVVLPWRSALGWVDKEFVARASTAVVAPAIQLVDANVRLGTAAGALREVLGGARASTPARSPGGGDRGLPVGPLRPDVPSTPEAWDDLRSGLRTAWSLADQAADAIELLHIDPVGLGPHARGEVEVLVTAAAQGAHDVDLEIGRRVSEVGARAAPDGSPTGPATTR